MSRYNNGGRRPNRQKFADTDLYDVTINDFANSSTYGSERIKKNRGQINQVVKEVKQLNLVEVEQTWEHKLDILDKNDFQEEQTGSLKKPNSRRKKRNNTSDPVESDNSGVDYPIDIWFLISEYIYPEDVGKFAAICKTSLAVLSTARFWLNLYKRYYRRVADMPLQLQPEGVVRRYGLRAHVIRALHFMYPPFVAKIKPQIIFDGDPHILTKRSCILAWSKKIKNYWLFFFKFKKHGPLLNGRMNDHKEPKPDLLELLEDITANADKDCKVLQVTCLNYIILPMLSGHILNSVSLNVSQGMRYKLQLNFGSGPFPGSSSYPMILEPVVNLRILDWWHPSFPHSNGLNTNFYSIESAIQQFDELEF